MSDCLFCKIIAGEIPSEKIFENDKVYGFRDIAPMAKEHYLFIKSVFMGVVLHGLSPRTDARQGNLERF